MTLTALPTGTAGCQPHRIALIGPSRSRIAQPFLGGLQAHVWTLTRALRARGHHVDLFAAPGSDPTLHPIDLELDLAWLSDAARADVSMAPDLVVAEHHAYLDLMLRLACTDDYDVVHNHSLHYLPIAMADTLPIPMLTTLHTPPTPWLESAIRAARRRGRFATVSRHTARAWRQLDGDIAVVPNGIDTIRWSAGPGGHGAVWSGRIAPEKGLHLAIAAARMAGVGLDIAGPIVDHAYFERTIKTQLGGRVRYLGHLEQHTLADVIRHACVALVTPDWDEPYGLVVAEALACGTPVVAFARGGIPEIVDSTCARLVNPGDVVGLAAAIPEAAGLARAAARHRAVQHCSVDQMIDRYESVLRDVILARAA